MRIRRVYVAGRLTPRGISNPNPAIEYISNVRNMVRTGIELLLAGFTPYIPALDCLMFLLLRDDEAISEEMIKMHSLLWLEVCDAVLVMPGWEHSSGARAEVAFATERNIPVFKSIDELRAARQTE